MAGEGPSESSDDEAGDASERRRGPPADAGPDADGDEQKVDHSGDALGSAAVDPRDAGGAESNDQADAVEPADGSEPEGDEGDSRSEGDEDVAEDDSDTIEASDTGGDGDPDADDRTDADESTIDIDDTDDRADGDADETEVDGDADIEENVADVGRSDGKDGDEDEENEDEENGDDDAGGDEVDVDDDDVTDDEAARDVDDDDGLLGGLSGPEDDREMPLADHIEEMVKRLAVVVAIAGLVSLLTFPVADQVINFLWYSIMPGVPSDIARPRLYGVLEKLFTELKVASLAGLIVALPVLVYETYAFMRPGLYPHERRYYLAAVPTSLVLAIVGVAFAYFVVLPAIFVYFLYYSQDVATIGFALGRTFDLILLMMGYLAIVFQIPLLLMLAMMMGLVTRRWLAERRLLFWGAFLGLSFFFGFDPTGMAPIIVAATMIALFEGTLLLTKWTGRE